MQKYLKCINTSCQCNLRFVCQGNVIVSLSWLPESETSADSCQNLRTCCVYNFVEGAYRYMDVAVKAGRGRRLQTLERCHTDIGPTMTCIFFNSLAHAMTPLG